MRTITIDIKYEESGVYGDKDKAKTFERELNLNKIEASFPREVDKFTLENIIAFKRVCINSTNYNVTNIIIGFDNNNQETNEYTLMVTDFDHDTLPF